jgi:membrane protease YdiL (CAAX protease family)
VSAESISAARAAWLLIELAARRTANRMGHGGSRGAGLLRLFGVGAALMLNSAYVVGLSLTRAQELIGPVGLRPLETAFLCVLLLTILFCNLSLMNKDLAKPDADLEWLLTLPASAPALYAAKIARSTLWNPAGWTLLFPFLLTLSLRDGPRALALLQVTFCSAALLAVVGVWSQVLEAAGRAWLRSLANAQAVAALLATTGVTLLLSPLFFVVLPRPAATSWLDAIRGLTWLPFSESLALIAPDPLSARDFFGTLAKFLLQITLAVALGLFALWSLATRGFVLGRGARHGKRGARTAAQQGRSRPRWLPGVVAKDLKWLWRDKSSLSEAVLITAACLAQIALLNALSAERLKSPEAIGAAAFACGATLLGSTTTGAFRSEAKACWILFTVPRSLTRVLLQKTVLWLLPAVGVALGVFAWGLTGQAWSARYLFWILYALVGLAFHALLGTALAAQRFEANAEPSPARRALAGYETSLLAAPVFFGFLTSACWSALQTLILFGALTAAAVQNATRRLPHLLEPAAPLVSGLRVSDGLLAALFFSLLEGAIFPLAVKLAGLSVGAAQALAFTLAGSIVSGATFWFISRRGAPGALVLLGLANTRGQRAFGKSLAVCLPAVLLVAIAHRAFIAHEPWLASASAVRAPTNWSFFSTSERIASLGVAVLVAPVVEEIVFRGLIHRALRKSFDRVASILLSSACFALVHPLASMLPVFLGAICAALALELSGALAASILVHAVYNAAALLLWVG